MECSNLYGAFAHLCAPVFQLQWPLLRTSTGCCGSSEGVLTPTSRIGQNRKWLRGYSNSSSARAISEGGRASPSALAALRLTTKSYLVGACTGKSAGFSPFRMRST